MSLEADYKQAVKDELDYSLRVGRGKGFKTKLTLYLKALIRIIKLTYLYERKRKDGGVKHWLDLLDFLRRVLSALR